jgi:hypothetical protein
MATPPDFTSGQVLTAAQMNAVGMWLVKSDSVSGANPTITDAFSSDFVAYKIVFSELICSNDTNFYLRMGTTAGSAYYWAGINREWISTSIGGGQGNGVAQWATGIIGNGSRKTAGSVELQMPQLAQPTTFSCSGGDTRTNGAGAYSYSGFLNNTTQYTSFSLLLDGANTITSCNIRVYGYNY